VEFFKEEKSHALFNRRASKMITTQSTTTHHGLIFRSAPSIRQNDNQEIAEALGQESSAQIFQSSQLGFIPIPDDLEGELDREFSRKQTLISSLPDGDIWAERFVILALEVMAGSRPIAQLSRWCSRKVFTYLIENIHPKKTMPKLGKLHISKPTEECMEVVLLLHSPVRKRALMARFEAVDGRWLCTVLQIL
jgi:hypothetical protein